MSSEVVFEYTGAEVEDDVPKDVTIVRFHSSVTEVSNDMFRECEQLKKVVLNEGLRKIGKHSFLNCRKLEHINFPSTLIEVCEWAFRGCCLRDVVLNEGLLEIKQSAFQGCQLLKSITLPSTIHTIGAHAFCGCHGLSEVILNEGLQTIGAAAFASCTSLEGSITIPSTITMIVDSTFYNCQRLREVGLHDRIQMFGCNAFTCCTSLERFTFPNLTTRLENTTRAGLTEVEDKIDGICCLVERRGSEVFISDKRLVQGRNWDLVKGILGRIDRIINFYELKEATTLLELAIWKSKIDQTEENLIKRDAHRIDIPGPVRDTILQYLNFRVIGDNFLVERVLRPKAHRLLLLGIDR